MDRVATIRDGLLMLNIIVFVSTKEQEFSSVLLLLMEAVSRARNS